jgi:uncharacterized protein YihD (DUF1040 family)
MNRHTVKALVLIATFAGCTSPAQAFLGFGDVVFDATSYGELASIYDQGTQMLQSYDKQLSTMHQLQEDIKKANQVFDHVANTHLKQYTQMLPGESGTASQYKALMDDILREQKMAGTDSTFINAQNARLKNMQALDLLKQASTQNTERASGKTNQQTSTQITAQSTAALAALAASEEQRRQLDEYRRSQSGRNENDQLRGTGNYYRQLERATTRH